MLTHPARGADALTWPMLNGNMTAKSFVDPKGTVHITEGNGGVPGVGAASSFTMNMTSDFGRSKGTGAVSHRLTSPFACPPPALPQPARPPPPSRSPFPHLAAFRGHAFSVRCFDVLGMTRCWYLPRRRRVRPHQHERRDEAAVRAC